MTFLLSLADPWAYFLVGLLAAGEAAAFIGLFIPGETAMLLGGVLVFQGRADLAWMLAAGCSGAVIGDSIGYQIGKHFGPRLRATRLGRKVGEGRWDRATTYVRERGGRAVFFGRFVGVLRALVPAIAGMAGIRYRTFLFFNVIGGVIWATAFILLGVLAGGSYHLVERWAGRATLVLLVLAAVVAGVFLGARYVTRHQDELIARWRRFLERPRVKALRSRYYRQLTFVGRRLEPGRRTGLFLTLGLVLAISVLWFFGAILQDVLGHDELALFDRPIVSWLASHREPLLTTVMQVITSLGSTVVVIPILVAGLAFTYLRTRSTTLVVVLAASSAGGQLLDDVVKALVGRPRPNIHPLVDTSGSAFPSGHATAATALFLALAYVLTRERGWAASTWIWAGALFVAMLVGFSRVYLGAHWPTDVVGGFALGGGWTAIVASSTGALARGHAGGARASILHRRGT